MIDIFPSTILSYVVGYITACMILITSYVLVKRKGISNITFDLWVPIVTLSLFSWLSVVIFILVIVIVLTLNYSVEWLPKVFNKPFTRIDKWLKSKNIID